MNGMGSSNLGHLINHAFLKSLCRMLGFVAIGDATCPDQGQTTINVLQETNKGLLFIRFNPTLKDKLETGCAIFEIESLCFFAKNKIPVPIPLKFGDEFYYETDKWIICAYFCLPGLAINRSELSVSLAVKMGEFLCKVVEVSAKYPSERTSKEQFLNSFKYIIEVAEKIEKSVPELEHSKLWNIMKMTTETNQDILKNTPKGIVHADYFYENILKDQNGNIVGLIDFGDAYHGHILHDVAIGAMESCILEEAASVGGLHKQWFFFHLSLQTHPLGSVVSRIVQHLAAAGFFSGRDLIFLVSLNLQFQIRKVDELKS